VKASGDTGYSCIVAGNGDRVNYYRVMQRDVDGKKSYSKVVVLQPLNGVSALSIYPNPAKDRLYVAGVDGFTTISIIDLSGRVIGSEPANPATPYIDVSQLAKGMYFLRLAGEKGMQTIKFFKE
jgi:hypothetical protein